MTQFNVKCSPELKKQFFEACKELDTTASKEVREFMRQFLKKHSQKEFKL